MDLAWLDYQRGRREEHLDALVCGKGTDADLRERLRLYQLSYALSDLWWQARFDDRDGVERVLGRIIGLARHA